LSEIQETMNFWSNQSFNGYPDAKKQLLEFETYKITIKRSRVVEKRDLGAVS
jgi:hypothetical protein